MKKRFLSTFFCLFILAIQFMPTTAAEHKIFDLKPERVDTIRITTGGGASNTLTSAQDAELIRQIIQSLNDFKYEETEQLDDIHLGVYVQLLIKEKDGLEKSIQIDSDGAYAPNNPDNIRYIASDPDYFGVSWVNSLFPDPFTDIHLWAYPPAKMVYENGLMLGTSETTFSPDAVMTRGMFITILGRMAEIDEEDYRESSFEDVPESDYFFPYVSWAVQNGIAKGTSANAFSPNAPVTREQAVVLLARYAEALGLEFLKNNHSSMNFTDIQNTSKEFQEKLPVLYGADIFRGPISYDIFDPRGTMTRAEAADILAETIIKLYDKQS